MPIAPRYRWNAVLFAAVWIGLGCATVLVAPMAHSGAAADMALGWVGQTSGAVVLAVPALSLGMGGFGLAPRPRYWLLVFGLLALLAPLHAGFVAYAVATTRETATGLLVVSATFAWPGVANLAGMLVYERFVAGATPAD